MKSLLFQFLLPCLLPLILVADSPREAPSNKKVHSPNHKFFALLEPTRQLTTVYRAGKPNVKLWEMPGWHPATFLSNDGDHLVIGYDGVNLLDPGTNPKEPMITLFNRGKQVAVITLGDLVKDQSKLMRTESHLFWGDYIGFTENGDFRLRTADGITYAVSPEGHLQALTPRQ